MKTDISIPTPVFHAVENLAKKIGITISDLYTAALTAYVTEHQTENVTAELDHIYTEEASTLEPELVKMQVVSLEGNSLRLPGNDKGKIIVQPDFDDPLEEFEL